MQSEPAPQVCLLMTRRARAYQAILSARHIVLGLLCLFVPQAFTAESFETIKGVLPVDPHDALRLWGVLFTGAGLLAAYSVVRARVGEARWALLASILSSSLWAGGFIVYVFSTLDVSWAWSADPWPLVAWDGGLWPLDGRAPLDISVTGLENPSGAVIWTAVVLKDITMLRDPLRNPYEEVQQRALAVARASEARQRRK